MARTRRYWVCPGCSFRNERAHRLCRGEGCKRSKPKRRVRPHARIIQGDTYHLFVAAAEEIHNVTDESCCVCGKPRSQDRRHDRDHCHRTGVARGLACPGNTGCNMLMVSWVTASTAQGIADAKREAGEPDAERWALIAAYLERVERFYAVHQTEEGEGGD